MDRPIKFKSKGNKWNLKSVFRKKNHNLYYVVITKEGRSISFAYHTAPQASLESWQKSSHAEYKMTAQ